MKRGGTHGFTLIELLVVIAIIGILVGLLMSAVLAAQRAALRTKCTNQQRQLVLAVQGFESQSRGYPGYRSNLTASGKTVTVSWATRLLPHMGRADIWTRFQSNPKQVSALGTSDVWAIVIGDMVCPADPPDTLHLPPPFGPSAYCANHLIFVDAVSTSPRAASSVTDGESCTLMISENVGRWMAPGAAALTSFKPHNWYDFDNVANLQTQPATSTSALTLLTTFGITKGSIASMSAMAANVKSNHGGGVIAAFCDGSVRFLSDDVGMTTTSGGVTIYQALVTPDGAVKGTSGEMPLNDSDWQ